MRYLKFYETKSGMVAENNPVVPSVSYAKDTQNLIYLSSSIPLIINNNDKLAGSIEINGTAVQLDGSKEITTKINSTDGYITIGNIVSNDSSKAICIYPLLQNYSIYNPVNLEEILAVNGETIDSMYELYSKIDAGEVTVTEYLAKCKSAKMMMEFETREKYTACPLSGSNAKYQVTLWSGDIDAYLFYLYSQYIPAL